MSKKSRVDTDTSLIMSQSIVAPESVIYRSNIQVIYHKRKLFMETFKQYIDDVHLIEKSLSPLHNRDQVFKAGEGAGSSGSFFFFSHDQKFIIKTMTQYEVDLMLEKISSFATHYQKNPDSLICKIFGIFTLKAKLTNEVHLMMMENTL